MKVSPRPLEDVAYAQREVEEGLASVFIDNGLFDGSAKVYAEVAVVHTEAYHTCQAARPLACGHLFDGWIIVEMFTLEPTAVDAENASQRERQSHPVAWEDAAGEE